MVGTIEFTISMCLKNNLIMDIQSILNNQNVKDILKKVGVDEAQQEKVISQAVNVVKTKAIDNPQGIMSLFSSQPNTSDDNKLQSGMQNDLLKDLIAKVGLPADVAEKVSSSLPDILKNVTGGKGFDLGSLTGVLESFTGDGKKGKSSGLGSLISKFFKK